jgi:hypothetical protein
MRRESKPPSSPYRPRRWSSHNWQGHSRTSPRFRTPPTFVDQRSHDAAALSTYSPARPTAMMCKRVYMVSGAARGLLQEL